MAVNIKDLAVRCGSFDAGEPIPREHAVEGDDTCPVLEISGAPEGTVELAVVCHDPDAPMPRGFTHWLVYGLPPNTSTVREGEAGREGPNSLGENAWTGPNPPPGHGTHHYYFWVYALDAVVEGTPSREEFLDTYGDHVLEQNRVVGTYSR